VAGPYPSQVLFIADFFAAVHEFVETKSGDQKVEGSCGCLRGFFKSCALLFSLWWNRTPRQYLIVMW
jgi:hypothetical protein